MENHSENVIYELPDSPFYAEYKFQDILFEIEGSDCSQPAPWTKTMIMPVDTEDSILTFKLTHIAPQGYGIPQTPDVQVAIFREGVSTSIPLDSVSFDISSCKGNISLSKMNSGVYYLYIGNAQQKHLSILNFPKSMGNGVGYRFRLLKNGIHYQLPEIQRFNIFCAVGITLYFKTPININESWLHYEYCKQDNNITVSSDWLEITPDGKKVNMGSRPSVRFEDGTYNLKLYYNNELKAHIRFRTKDYQVVEFEQDYI